MHIFFSLRYIKMNSFRIVEFGCYYAAPLVGRYLVGYGCTVTAVERPSSARGVDCERRRIGSEARRHLSAGKSIAYLDLTTSAGRHRASALIADAHVVIENFGPGVAARLGIDAEACRRINPNVLHLSLPGFMPGDTIHEQTPAFESILLASAGALCDMGLNRVLLGVDASYTPLLLASVYGSVHAAFAVVCALFAGRRGESITVPLASALSETMVHNSITFPKDETYMNPRARRVHRGNYPIDGATLDTLFDPFFRLYDCACGRKFYLVCPSHRRHQRDAIRILEVQDAVGMSDEGDIFADDVVTSGLGKGSMSEEDAKRVYPILRSAFLRRTADDWEFAFGIQGVPGCKVRTTEEWKVSSHVRDAGLIAEDGRLSNIGWLEEPAFPSPPSSLQDHLPLASATGFPEAHSGGDDAPLFGIRVVDMSNVIAAPTIGTMLARMGATVVKVDPVAPTYAPDVSVIYGLATNIGKESVLLDSRSADGRALLERLLIGADVLIVNCNQACLHRMRLSRDELAHINPRLILARFDAWSGPNAGDGIMSEYNGYDDCVQAAIGIMARFGGSVDTPEEHAHIGTIDVVAGVSGALAVAVALIERRRRGMIYTARSSLAAVGQYLQLPFMFSMTTTSRSSLGYGIHCVGETEAFRILRVRDGWLMVVGDFFEDGVDKVLRRLSTHTPHRSLDDLASLTMAQARAQLAVARIPHGIVQSIPRLRRRYTVDCFVSDAPLTFQFLLQQHHPVGGVLCIVAPVGIRMRGYPTFVPSALYAPKYGSHTNVVLQRLGLASVLFHDGAISHAWSKKYIPFFAACQRCGRRGTRILTLTCQHSICNLCNGHASTLKSTVCPLCGQEHDLHLNLCAKFRTWRVDYGHWRGGNARGALDMERIRRPVATTLRRTRSF